jgi:hypothetical protein
MLDQTAPTRDYERELIMASASARQRKVVGSLSARLRSPAHRCVHPQGTSGRGGAGNNYLKHSFSPATSPEESLSARRDYPFLATEPEPRSPQRASARPQSSAPRQFLAKFKLGGKGKSQADALAPPSRPGTPASARPSLDTGASVLDIRASTPGLSTPSLSTPGLSAGGSTPSTSALTPGTPA